MRERKGFTLVELAIVLIIIGIVIGIGAKVADILLKKAKYDQTKELLDTALKGISAFSSSAGRLPTGSELASVIQITTDPYGNPIYYVYDSSLSTSSPCERTSTNITINICSDATCSSPVQTIENVAFILISGNGNSNNQTHGGGQVNSATTVNVYQYGVDVDNYSGDVNRIEPYDDVVVWMTLQELRGEMNCPSLSPNITSPTNLPPATEEEGYSYTLTAEGGVNLKWGVLSGGTCDISNASYTFGTGGWLTLERDTGQLQGVANEDTTSPPGVISSCTATVNLNVCVCSDINGNNTCDSNEPYDSQTLSLIVNPQPIRITTTSLPTARADGTSPYTATLGASGGTGSYTFSSPNFPYDYNSDADNEFYLTGSTITTSGDATNFIPDDDPGTCTGNVFNFTITATPQTSCPPAGSDTKAFSITIEDPDCFSGGSGGGGSSGSGSCSSPLILTPPSGGTYTATVGVAFGPLIVSVSGGLPPYTNTQCTPASCNGLTLSCSSSQATISGTPTAAGTCIFTVGWQDSCSPPNSITGQYIVNIDTSCDPLSGFISSLADAEMCKTYLGSISVIGGEPPYTWALSGGSFPGGLSFCSGNTTNICNISGSTYELPGTYTFNVTVTDSCPVGAQTLSSSFSINVVYPAGREGRELFNCIDDDGGIKLTENINNVNVYYTTSVDQTCRQMGGNIIIEPGVVYNFYWDSQCQDKMCSATICDAWNAEWSNNFSNCDVYLNGGDGTTCNISDTP